MSILVNKDSRVLVQGITGIEGTFHTTQMIGYGTMIAGGVTPGKGGTMHLGLPVFDTVKEARSMTGANVSIIFVRIVTFYFKNISFSYSFIIKNL